MTTDKLLDTVNRLIEEARGVLATQFDASEPGMSYVGGRPRGVDLERFAKFQAGGTNLLRLLGDAGASWKDNFGDKINTPLNVARMLGTLRAIADAIQHGLLVKVEDWVRAEAFGSLLDQADYLLAEGYFLAGGVLGRAVLEEHLRKWCALNLCSPAKGKPTLQDLIGELYRAKHINLSVMKHFEALAAVGNVAAHNKPELTLADVERLLRDVRDVLARYP